MAPKKKSTPSPGAVTLQDIADAAGVSRAAVSYALRNDPQVSKATAARIRKIAEQLEYRPNPMISSLMHKLRSRQPAEARSTIGLLTAYSHPVEFRRNPVLKSLEGGMRERAEAAGFSMDVFNLDPKVQRPERLVQILKSRGIRGVLLLPLSRSNLNGFEAILAEPFSFATYGYTLQQPDLHRVCAHHLQIMFLATSRLKEAGYRQIGLVMATWADNYYHNWLAAYAAVQAGLDESERVPPFVPCEDDDVGNSCHAWIRKHHVDGLLLASSLLPDWLGSFDIPAELGIAHLHLPRGAKGAGIRQNNWAIGHAMVDLVVGQLNRNECGIPESPKTILVKGSWIDGSTVRTPSKANSGEMQGILDKPLA